MRNHFIFYCNHSYLVFFASSFPSPPFHPLHLLLNLHFLLVIHYKNLVGVLLLIFDTHRIHTHIHIHPKVREHCCVFYCCFSSTHSSHTGSFLFFLKRMLRMTENKDSCINKSHPQEVSRISKQK